jgi:hypothetical protein
MAQAPIYTEGGGSSYPAGSTSTTSGTTGGTSSGSTGGTAPASSFSSPGAGTWDIPVAMEFAGVPKNAPALELGAGEVVEIAPFATNTQAVYVSTVGADAAKSNPRRALLATSNPITLNVRNLCEVWVYAGVVGEGVTLTVRKR